MLLSTAGGPITQPHSSSSRFDLRRRCQTSTQASYGRATPSSRPTHAPVTEDPCGPKWGG
jgi:hypothetical protein